MEKVPYCFYKIILKSTRESNKTQPCLHSLIKTHLSTSESAGSSEVILKPNGSISNISFIKFTIEWDLS